MGRNLALNIAGHGYGVAVHDAWPEARQAFLDDRDKGTGGIALRDGLADFAATLSRPRAVLLLVKAGTPVDDQIEDLLPLLEPGDLVIDAGNAHYEESERRGAELAEGDVFHPRSNVEKMSRREPLDDADRRRCWTASSTRLKRRKPTSGLSSWR